MRVADLILELGKQPLDAEVIVETSLNSFSSLKKDSVVYVGQIDLGKGKGPQKSILIDTSVDESMRDYIDTVLIEGDNGYQEVVLFKPFADIEKALTLAKEMVRTLPYANELKPITAEDTSVVWIMDNPEFEVDPGEEDAYFYAEDKDVDAYPVLQIPLIYKKK